MYDPLFKPGIIEVYCGPMKCGKSEALIDRVDRFRFKKGVNVLFFKPDKDTRDNLLVSRSRNSTYKCIFLDHKNPHSLFKIVNDDNHIIVIDEAQFFKNGLAKVVEKLAHFGKNVIVGGLDLDFRGEPYGPMPDVLSIANEIYKMTAVCDVCGGVATRSQRLVGGLPAHYEEPTDSIESKNSASEERYEARCIRHHIVPGKK